MRRHILYMSSIKVAPKSRMLALFCAEFGSSFKIEKRSQKTFASAFLFSLRAGNLARAQATGANRHGGGGPVNDSLYLTDIGLPRTVGLAMGVGNVLTEHNALSANTALCHIDTSSCTPWVLSFICSYFFTARSIIT